jgi:hypothetical protein
MKRRRKKSLRDRSRKLRISGEKMNISRLSSNRKKKN